MTQKTSYHSLHFFSLAKGLITLCLLLSMLAKPVAGIVFQIADIKQELSECFGEMEPEEKEDTTDQEDEDEKLHPYSILDSKLLNTHLLSLSHLQKNIIGDRPDTPFPPPDWC